MLPQFQRIRLFERGPMFRYGEGWGLLWCHQCTSGQRRRRLFLTHEYQHYTMRKGGHIHDLPLRGPKLKTTSRILLSTHRPRDVKEGKDEFHHSSEGASKRRQTSREKSRHLHEEDWRGPTNQLRNSSQGYEWGRGVCINGECEQPMCVRGREQC